MNSYMIYMRDLATGYEVAMALQTSPYAIQAVAERLAASLGLQYNYYNIMPA